MTHMYYADLEITYEDGSKGAKRFDGLSLESVQKQADKKLRECIATAKFAKETDADKTFQIKSHKISAGKLVTDTKFNA